MIKSPEYSERLVRSYLCEGELGRILARHNINAPEEIVEYLVMYYENGKEEMVKKYLNGNRISQDIVVSRHPKIHLIINLCRYMKFDTHLMFGERKDIIHTYEQAMFALENTDVDIWHSYNHMSKFNILFGSVDEYCDFVEQLFEKTGEVFPEKMLGDDLFYIIDEKVRKKMRRIEMNRQQYLRYAGTPLSEIVCPFSKSELKRRVNEMRYKPGGPGYVETMDHFYSLNE